MDRIRVWSPQEGPQKALVDCGCPEIFFGGARGGGKTDGVLGKWALKERRYGNLFNAVGLRRTSVSFEDAIERAKQIYCPLGAKFADRPARFRMPNGGRVTFSYLENDNDALEYQGRNVTDAWVEEAGQYASSSPIDKLFGVLRSSGGVPAQLILTANPGGAGQHWIRERYKLFPFPEGPKLYRKPLPNGQIHSVAVIPSRITDNRILIEHDPGYVGRLHLVGSRQLVQAWLEGDWSAVEGAFFSEWSTSRHIVHPFEIPEGWLRFRSGDWGSARPFAFYWFAVVPDPYVIDGLTLPRGALVVYREWYGCVDGKPNTGLKMTAEEVGAGVKVRDRCEKITYGVLDPAAFSEDGGPSIAERMGCYFRKADNKRVPGAGALGGWDQMRARLKGNGEGPMLVFFSTCAHAIRTIPTLQHDSDRPEDLDTEAEDHAADAVRYGCMSRPYIPSAPEKTPPRDAYRDMRARNSVSDGLDTLTI